MHWNKFEPLCCATKLPGDVICVYSLRNYCCKDIKYNHYTKVVPCELICFAYFEGYYMYIETSYPRKKGDKARFISPTYAPVKGGQCFQFWYHMYGQDIGSLNVYIKTGGNLSNPLWTRSGNRGNVWKVTQVSITASSSFNVCALFWLVWNVIFLLFVSNNSLLIIKYCIDFDIHFNGDICV